MPIIVQQKAALESETILWAGNVAANGGSISEQTLRANDNLIKDLKSNGLRSKIQYLITYSGNNLAAALCPIIYDVGNAVATNNNFIAGDFLEAIGLTGNGSTKYLNTGVPSSTWTNTYSISCGAYIKTKPTNGTNAYVMGVVANSTTGRLHINRYISTDTYYGYVGDSISVDAHNTSNDENFVVINRTSSTTIRLIRNGSVTVGSTTAVTMSGFSPSKNCYLFAMNNAGLPGYYANATMWLNYFGLGLSSTDEVNLNTVVQNFKARMGR